MVTLSLGFLLGLEHAADADHIVAVSTIVSRSRRLLSAMKVGMLWGLGHTLTILLAGLAIIVLKLSIPEKVALGAEFAVGIMLVLLGLLVLWELRRDGGLRLHRHPHRHAEADHVHIHLHSGEEAHHHRHGIFPFLVGLVHGLAGSAPLTLLVLSTIDNTFWGLAYILSFGLASILGMMLFGGIISLPFIFTSGERWQRFHLGIRLLAGLLSIALGGAMMFEIGMGQGLLLRL